MASLFGIIPEEYCRTLSVLQDQAPSVNFDQLENIFLEDIGLTVDELFSEFDRKPIAAASLAQVHRAVVKGSGKEVAVKIQYPNLRRNFNGDMLAQDFILFGMNTVSFMRNFWTMVDELQSSSFQDMILPGSKMTFATT